MNYLLKKVITFLCLFGTFTLLSAQETGRKYSIASQLSQKFQVQEISTPFPTVPGGCSPNLAFEEGTFNLWNCFIGTTFCSGSNNGINMTPSPPVAGRHSIITRTLPSPLDPFGNFPINPPDGSQYCVKLGNTGTGSQAERISYNISIPATASNFSINYNYAVVFQDPNHNSCEQPRFSARVLDPVTNTYLPCGSNEYVSTSGIPGFLISPVNTTVKYKPWSSAYINLTAYAGMNVVIEFTTVDCTLGGHWGYAYLDVDDVCNLTADVQFECEAPNITTLTGPPGFQAYKWWNFDFSTLLGSTEVVVLNPGLAPGTNLWVEVIPYSGFGCRDTLAVQIAITYPVADFTAPPNQCRSTDFNFISSSWIATGTIGQHYWDFGDGNTAIGSNVLHQYASAGTYNVKLVVTSILGCKDSVTHTVVVNPMPVSLFTRPPDQCITNNNFNFSSNSTISSGSLIDYYWDFGDGNSANGINVSHSYTSSGSFDIKLIVTSDKGCKDSTIRTVIVFSSPTPSFTAPGGQCLRGNDFNFTSTSSGGGGIVSTTWNFGDGNVAIGNSVNHTYATPGVYSVKLVVTSTTGCKDSITQQINVYHQPVANFDQPANQCHSNNNIYLNSTAYIGGGGTIINYSWDWGDGNTGNTNPASHWYASHGTYDIRHVVTSIQGCIDSIRRSVTIYPQPVPDFVQPPAQCFTGNNFSFSSNSTVLYGSLIAFKWDFGDGIIANGTNATHSYTAPGIYMVKLLVTSDRNCIDSTVRIITVNADPIPGIISDRPIEFCRGDSTHLISSSIAGSGTIRSLQWYLGSSPVPGATNNSISVYNTGAYQLEVINSNGCIKKGATTVVTMFPLPVGAMALPAFNYLCEGTTQMLFVSSPGNSNQWYINNVLIPGATNSNYSATLPGTYTVVLTTPFGCVDKALGMVSLNLIKKPLPDFDFPTFCAGTPVNFENLSEFNQSGPVTWEWNFGDGGNSVAFNPVYTYTRGGKFTISLVATPEKCPNLANTAIKPITLEEASPGIRYFFVNAVKNIDQQLGARKFGNQYLWMPSSGLNNVTTITPVFNYDQPVQYIIRITSAAGCLTYDTQMVRMFKQVDIQVPKAFTPNGDGHNDKLDVFVIGIKELLYFRVFNRWGQLLYETKDPSQRWDGTYKGVKQPLETYVWMAEGIGDDGVKILRRGQTILIR